MTFAFYEQDIRYGFSKSSKELFDEQLEEVLSEELKLSCTNVMLQCLDPMNRCIFVLGTMFHVDSRIAADILQLSPEQYRQRLSRSRKKMATFLYANCGLSETGICNCKKRIDHAISQHRLDPAKLSYTRLAIMDRKQLQETRDAMQTFEDAIPVFEHMDLYESQLDEAAFVKQILTSKAMHTVMKG